MAKNTSVVLGDHFDQFLSSKINQGQYQSVSEAIRSGLHLLEQEDARTQAFRCMLNDGLNSALIKNFDEKTFFDELYQDK